MTKQLLPHDVTAEDRMRGCIWASTFRRPGDEVEKLGVSVGAPVINRGITFGGAADAYTYGLWGQFDYVTQLSFHMVLSDVGFAWDEGGVSRTFFDGTASIQYRLAKNAIDSLSVWIGGTGIVLGVLAVIAPLWNQNGRNVITGSFESGANNGWINGTQVLTAGATAWNPSVITELDVGQRSTGVERWPGTMESLHFYNSLLTAEDHNAIWAGGGA